MMTHLMLFLANSETSKFSLHRTLLKNVLLQFSTNYISEIYKIIENCISYLPAFRGNGVQASSIEDIFAVHDPADSRAHAAAL